MDHLFHPFQHYHPLELPVLPDLQPTNNSEQADTESDWDYEMITPQNSSEDDMSFSSEPEDNQQPSASGVDFKEEAPANPRTNWLDPYRFNASGIDYNGLDRAGKPVSEFNPDKYNPGGPVNTYRYNADGYDIHGVDKDGFDSLGNPGLFEYYERLAKVNAGYDAIRSKIDRGNTETDDAEGMFGTDKLAVDAEGYNERDDDYDAHIDYDAHVLLTAQEQEKQDVIDHWEAIMNAEQELDQMKLLDVPLLPFGLDPHGVMTEEVASEERDHDDESNQDIEPDRSHKLLENYDQELEAAAAYQACITGRIEETVIESQESAQEAKEAPPDMAIEALVKGTIKASADIIIHSDNGDTYILPIKRFTDPSSGKLSSDLLTTYAYRVIGTYHKIYIANVPIEAAVVMEDKRSMKWISTKFDVPRTWGDDSPEWKKFKGFVDGSLLQDDVVDHQVHIGMPLDLSNVMKNHMDD